MATLKDIGRRLNLSVTTVSRALNGFPEVNEATRILVVKTAKEMNYKPNQFAQKLVTGKSRMVCMIVKATPELSSNAHIMETVTGLSLQFSERGMHFILHMSNDEDPLEAYRSMSAGGIVDGFILTRPQIGDVRVKFLRDNKIPFVMHGRVLDDNDYPYYDIENCGAARQATDHLLSLGHRRISFLNGPADFVFAVRRRTGFLEALAAHGVKDIDVHHNLMTSEYGYIITKRILAETGGPRRTAFLCANTLIAEGVYRAVEEAGLRIPEDISVVSHDDAVPLRRALDFNPPLTVTRSPLRESFEPLADTLMKYIKGDAVETLQTLVKPELIIRQSTCPPPL